MVAVSEHSSLCHANRVDVKRNRVRQWFFQYQNQNKFGLLIAIVPVVAVQRVRSNVECRFDCLDRWLRRAPVCLVGFGAEFAAVEVAVAGSVVHVRPPNDPA